MIIGPQHLMGLDLIRITEWARGTPLGEILLLVIHCNGQAVCLRMSQRQARLVVETQLRCAERSHLNTVALGVLIRVQVSDLELMGQRITQWCKPGSRCKRPLMPWQPPSETIERRWSNCFRRICPLWSA